MITVIVIEYTIQKTSTFFTGPRSRYLVEQHFNNRDVDRWRMFVLSSSASAKDFMIKEGTCFLFQVNNFTTLYLEVIVRL